MVQFSIHCLNGLFFKNLITCDNQNVQLLLLSRILITSKLQNRFTEKWCCLFSECSLETMLIFVDVLITREWVWPPFWWRWLATRKSRLSLQTLVVGIMATSSVSQSIASMLNDGLSLKKGLIALRVSSFSLAMVCSGWRCEEIIANEMGKAIQ